MGDALVRVSGLRKTFRTRHGHIDAVSDVSFEIREGQTLGLVGESGSGKTTLARCLLRLIDWDAGEVEIAGEPLSALHGRDLRRFRRNAQMVFQNPLAALNPRMRVADIIADPLVLHTDLDRRGRRARVIETLRRVQLSEVYADRLPRELSGGEQQRVGIARASITEPRLAVLDEPTAAIDAKLRQGIYDLLAELQREMGLTYVLISHDLSAVWSVSHRVAVMYLGGLVEIGKREQVFRSPGHPYTVALLSAVPRLRSAPGSRRVILAGELSAASADGCRFLARCPLGFERCAQAQPPLEPLQGGHAAACFRAAEVPSTLGDGGFMPGPATEPAGNPALREPV